MPPSGALDVLLTFTLPRPASHFGKRGLLPSAPQMPAVRPDLDKLTRAAADGLVDGGAVSDDARIVILTAEKAYATVHNPPGLTAWIESIPRLRPEDTT